MCCEVTLSLCNQRGLEIALFFIGGNMGSYRDSISGIGIIVKNREQKMLGSGAEGRHVPPEKGRRSIFVPSFGAMEQDEIDYVVEVAQEQEDERIKENHKSLTKERLEAVASAAMNAPRGERAKAAKEVIESLKEN